MTGKEIQPDSNYAKINNRILELCAGGMFSATESACLFALFRKTYGWGQKQDAISYSQLATMTHRERRTVIRAMQSLEQKRVIIRIDNGNNRAATWQFNKYFEQWDGVQTSVASDTSSEQTSDTGDTTSGDSHVTSSPPTSDTTDTATSDTADTHKRKKESSSSTAPAANPFIAAYEHAWGRLLTPMEYDEARDWQKRVTIDGWQYALKESVDHNARNWKYLRTILNRIERDGYTPNTNGTTPTETVNFDWQEMQR